MRWVEQWWWKIPDLIGKTEAYYARCAAQKPEVNLINVTTQKIIEARGWQPALPFIKANFAQVLAELKVFYVPKTFEPGPLFAFPIRGIDGAYTRAQTKPLEGSVLYGDGKYHWMGEKREDVAGPQWLGNDPATILRILEKRYVILVEGPFDLIACRLLAPEVPVMSPLTKSLNDKHEAWLRMLGVDTLILMFDNERPDESKTYDIGGGNLSMRVLKYKIRSMQVLIKLLEGGDDPAAALRSVHGAKKLRDLLVGDEL